MPFRGAVLAMQTSGIVLEEPSHVLLHCHSDMAMQLLDSARLLKSAMEWRMILSSLI